MEKEEIVKLIEERLDQYEAEMVKLLGIKDNSPGNVIPLNPRNQLPPVAWSIEDVHNAISVDKYASDVLRKLDSNRKLAEVFMRLIADKIGEDQLKHEDPFDNIRNEFKRLLDERDPEGIESLLIRFGVFSTVEHWTKSHSIIDYDPEKDNLPY